MPLSPRSESKTISENSSDSQTSHISVEEEISRETSRVSEAPESREETTDLPNELVKEMLKAALQKMLKVRQNKHQKELNLSPKFMERSPTSPEQLSPTRGEPAIFNDTFRDGSDLESALSLARSCVTAEERPVMTPEVPPPPKVCCLYPSLSPSVCLQVHLLYHITQYASL